MEIDFNITDESIEESIVQEIYIQAGFKTVICIAVIHSGAEIVGSYSPVSTAVSIIEGKKFAREDAKIKIRSKLEAIHQWQYSMQEESKRIQAEKDTNTNTKPEEPAKPAGKKPKKEVVK